MRLIDKIESLKEHFSDQQGICLDLSKEEFLDYGSLASLIKKSSFLDTLLLPRLKKDNAKEVLDLLNEVTIENTTLTNIRLNLLAFGGEVPDEIDFVYQQIRSRLLRNKKRIFAIHGGGYIGLGLMADIISQSPFDYNIFATSSDKFTNLLINSIHKFWIQHESSHENNVTCINNISMVYSRDSQNIIDLYVHSNIIAICLTEEGVLNSAKHIARGLISRYQLDQAGLKIFVLMNKTNCAEFVRNEVAKEILAQTNSPIFVDKVLASIQFIPTMVDRIVNKIDTQTLLNQIRAQLYKYKNLLKKQNIINSTKDIHEQFDTILNSPRKLIKVIKEFDLQINLFNAELSFVLYVPHGLPEVSRFPAITAVKNLDQFIMLKNKYINGPHAVLAWLGGLMGYRTIAQASQNSMIMSIIENMMRLEIAPILQAENPSISKRQLAYLKSTFINHCKKSKKDSILRVGRDPLRKTIQNGCIMGVINICKNLDLKISTHHLELGIAAGILYAINDIDPVNLECQKIKEIFNQSNSYKDILCYKGTYGNGNYPGLDEVNDKIIIQNILYQIKVLKGLIYARRNNNITRWGYEKAR